ncbi:uncharacterized protein [Apostichopus japonicus]|uniref:uncharacterized protein n=1 Tax=Stichopus japonicus TaxID=307972 RepID=UPI003AB46403
MIWKRVPRGRGVIFCSQMILRKKKIAAVNCGGAFGKNYRKNTGSIIKISNVEVDVNNDRHQLKSTTLTALEITGKQVSAEASDTIIGIDNEELDNISMITECGNTFDIPSSLLEVTGLDLIDMTPFQYQLTVEGV